MRITFGADFGIPRAITWYHDGAVLESNTSETGITNSLTHTVAPEEGTGEYYAVVYDNAGTGFKTNSITISDNEDKAVMTAFTIEEDYTDGTDVTYRPNTAKLVATVKMNKNFQGTFRIYEKKDTKYATIIDTMATAANVPAGAPRTTDAGGDATSILTASAGTNYDVLQQTAGSGQGFIAADGTVTYKWIVNNAGAGIGRGKEYVVTFDQTSKAEDNIGRGSENVFETAATAPYVTKPTKVEITKAAKNAPVEVTFYTGENGDQVMNFAGLQNPLAGVAAIGAKTTSDIYSATKGGVETKDANKKTAALNGPLKAGVWTVDGTVVTGTDAIWFASIDFNKGIYGDAEFTLRSADKQVAHDAAQSMAISYDKSKPNDIKVTFVNLRAKSTVYLVALRDSTARAANTATVSNETATDAFDRVYKDPTTAVASATVEAATGEYTFAGAIKGINVGDGTTTNLDGNTYIAMLVPEDEQNYSPTQTTGATGASAAVTAVLTSYKVAGKGQLTGKTASYGNLAAFNGTNDTGLRGYDQFGKEMKTTAFAADLVTNVKLTSATPTKTNGCAAPRRLTLAASTFDPTDCYGIITMGAADNTDDTYKGTDVDPVKDEAWTLVLSTGQTLKFTCSDAGNDATDCTWKVSIS